MLGQLLVLAIKSLGLVFEAIVLLHGRHVAEVTLQLAYLPPVGHELVRIHMTILYLREGFVALLYFLELALQVLSDLLLTVQLWKDKLYAIVYVSSI